MSEATYKKINVETGVATLLHPEHPFVKQSKELDATTTTTTAAGAERPIIFSGESVRAIMEGRKTQTRRVVKAKRIDEKLLANDPRYIAWLRKEHRAFEVGQRLWVRETFLNVDQRFKMPAKYERKGTYVIAYRADADYHADWSSPIHMPRWASRLTLEVTAVRVERLQEISEEDAKAEGVGRACSDPQELASAVDGGPGYFSPKSYSEGFELAWNHINGKKHPWSSNPWVWVIEFTPITR